MKARYIVRLSPEERSLLQALVTKGKTQAYRIKHANILLAVDADGPDWTNEKVAQALGCRAATVTNIRRRFVEQGLQAALERKKQDAPSRPRALDGEAEARLIALRCSPPPRGRARWTLQLLADKLVELQIVASISDQTVRRTLKKTNCGPTCAKRG